MADGMGDDDYGAPTLAQLKQMSWDIGYIRDKLTLDGISKCLVWRKGPSNQMIVGKIKLAHWNFLGALRSMAARIQAGEDGAAPPISDFGQSNYTQAQLQAMYDQLTTISAKIMMSKRTFVMRLSGTAGSSVELTIGDVEVSHDSYRTAIKYLADQVAGGAG